MGWKALLIILGFVTVGYIVLVIIYIVKNKKIKKLKSSVEKWKGKYQTVTEVLQRFKDAKINEEMSDDNAIQKINDLLSDWSDNITSADDTCTTKTNDI